jgi:hypothetical protein
MVQPEASRSSSAEFLLFLPPVPIPSGRLKKAACLLRTVSETSPEGLLPFPVPEQSSPVAGGTLQTLATGFCSVSYCNATKCKKCPVFLMGWIDKNGFAVPRWEMVSGRKDLQYRFPIEMNRFNRGRSASSPGNHDQTATIDFHRPDVRFGVASLRETMGVQSRKLQQPNYLLPPRVRRHKIVRAIVDHQLAVVLTSVFHGPHRSVGIVTSPGA